jgi:hypothetical protein
LVEAFADRFIGGGKLVTIVEARQLASTILGEPVQPGTTLAKLVDESVERGLVRAARVIVRGDNDSMQVYDRLVDLYQRQPTLGTRSSTSIAQQAYSTPLPIAYLAAQMAGIDRNTTVYEPTAGHGALLLTAEQSSAIANELNPERAADLRVQGYAVTQHDATSYLPPQQVDVVIANPPFGAVREDGRSRLFQVPGAGVDGRAFATTQIDHAIALNALKAMKDDGRAVLILGGKLGDERSRSNSYNSQQSRAFYYTLYNSYNVTKHFSIAGDLYSRQGAGFPIDIILIEGQGKSKLALPAASVPQIYQSFDELKELLSNAVHEYNQSLDARIDRTDERRSGGSVSAAEPGADIELQRISRVASNADRVDDPAGRESVRSVGDGEPLRQSGRDVLRGVGLADAERSTPEVGDRPDGGESLFSGEAELRIRNRVSRTSDAERPSLADNRADDLGGVAATDGSRTTGRLDVGIRAQKQETVTMPEPVTPDEISLSSEQPKQVPYIPSSTAQPANTLVPTNMQVGMANALARLQERVGSLDEYVAERLNYGSPEQLHRYLNAEQVDAVALAIGNLEKGRGFIIGDQTGVGKGRVVASVIRYAKQTGRTPIFITRDLSTGQKLANEERKRVS